MQSPFSQMQISWQPLIRRCKFKFRFCHLSPRKIKLNNEHYITKKHICQYFLSKQQYINYKKYFQKKYFMKLEYAFD